MKTPVNRTIRTFLVALACALLMLPGMAFAAGEKVSVTVIGPDADDQPVYYVGATEYELGEGEDGWTATAALLDQEGISYNAENSSYGVYLNSITSPVDGTELAWDEATGRYWQLFVDGAVSDVGISDVEIADGTQLVWYYSAFGDEVPEHAGTLHGLQSAAPSGNGGNGGGLAVAAVVVVAVIVGGALYMRKRDAA